MPGDSADQDRESEQIRTYYYIHQMFLVKNYVQKEIEIILFNNSDVISKLTSMCGTALMIT